MATSKKSFVLYTDIYSSLRELSINEKAELFDAIFKYHMDENYQLSPVANMAFSFMKSQFERDKIKYDEIVKRNRINGENGGRPSKKPKKPTGLSGNPKNPSEPKKPDNDNDNDNGTETDTVTDTDFMKKEDTVVSSKKKESTRNEDILSSLNLTDDNNGAIPAKWWEFARNELGWDDKRITDTFNGFVDYWRGKAGTAAGCKTDWLATWRNWCRRNSNTSTNTSNGSGGKRSSSPDYNAIYDRVVAG